MLLTDPNTRRQGLGTRLLERGCLYLQEAGVETVRLDGTPMGHSLYLQRGFEDEHEVQRWEGAPTRRGGEGLPLMTPMDLDGVCALDRQIFGADRSRLLSALWHENPLLSAVLRQGQEITGYLFGREGSRMRYLGPLVALSRAAAEEFGFTFKRVLTRMHRGPNRYPGAPHFVYGIAGPELG
jgi:hypothetical protein